MTMKKVLFIRDETYYICQENKTEDDSSTLRIEYMQLLNDSWNTLKRGQK